MKQLDNNKAGASQSTLPSWNRLFAFAVALPAGVAASNQLLFDLVPSFHLRIWLYPWMALSTAVLSWFVGRHLSPAWLRWLVFGWCLVLLDFLTIDACLSGTVENHFGYILVSSQISLIVLWAVLGTVNWQWRLPAVLFAAAAVIVFSGSFDDAWNARTWNMLMILTTIAILLLSAVIRLCGFKLQCQGSGMRSSDEQWALKTNQFGLKHILIWATALVPILLVMRGVDYFVLKWQSSWQLPI